MSSSVSKIAPHCIEEPCLRLPYANGEMILVVSSIAYCRFYSADHGSGPIDLATVGFAGAKLDFSGEAVVTLRHFFSEPVPPAPAPVQPHRVPAATPAKASKDAASAKK